MYDFSKVVITSSPHIKSKEDTKSIMLDVLLALIPSLAVSTYVFGLRAILMTAVSIIACMVFEAILRQDRRQGEYRYRSVRSRYRRAAGIRLPGNASVLDADYRRRHRNHFLLSASSAALARTSSTRLSQAVHSCWLLGR